jgi:hypothetical protein
MPRRLPPLNALPSFEAAARHLSFSKAADELHVTHGAVSRAIRNLEKHLGVQGHQVGTPDAAGRLLCGRCSPHPGSACGSYARDERPAVGGAEREHA